MSAAVESGFHSRMSAYGDFAEKVGPQDSQGGLIDALCEVARAANQHEDLPGPLEDLFEYVLNHRLGLKRREPNAVEGLVERLYDAFEFIKKDIDENIWDLLDEDVDPVSLEYVHSLISRSIQGYLNCLKSLESADGTEDKDKFGKDSFKYLNGFYHGLERLMYLNERKSFEESEKKAINDAETDIEMKNQFAGQEDLYDLKINASLIKE